MKRIPTKFARLLTLLLVLTAYAPSVFSQEPVIMLKHKELGKHQRPIVEFNHDGHADKIDCLQCHHDYDAYFNNRGGEGEKCGACHCVEAAQCMPGLKEAFHLQCKKCHEFLHSEGKPAGGITCGECHKRK